MMTETVQIPAPLQGCLYCHTEGSITLTEGRKILGFGSGLPTLTCSSCGSVALFEQGSDPDTWRIRYKNVNKSSRFYYVMLYLGHAGWLSADRALEISRNGYVQRQRIQQVQHGDLDWLRPAPLNPLALDIPVAADLQRPVSGQPARASQVQHDVIEA